VKQDHGITDKPLLSFQIKALSKTWINRPLKRKVRHKTSNLAGYIFISPWLIGFPVCADSHRDVCLASVYELQSERRALWPGQFQRMFTNDIDMALGHGDVQICVLCCAPAVDLCARRGDAVKYQAARCLVSRCILHPIIGGSVAVAVMAAAFWL
jgi:hypothetical protein